MVLKDFNSYCDLYGYTADKELSGFNDILKHKKFEKLHIGMYTKEPYMLLLNTEIENAKIVPDDNRLIIKSGGINKTTVMNIFKKDIDECIYKKYDANRYEIVFSLGGIFYRVFILIA